MKPLFVISCPIDTYSGYGARSRDLVKSLIEIDKYEVKVLAQRWGNCPWGFIDNHPEWKFLTPYILTSPQLPKQPDVWAQVTVPNEFQRMGKFNIGFTAGIETTICAPQWIEGLNRMDLNIVSSEHAKTTFLNSRYEFKDPNDNEKVKNLQIERPIEILFEGADLETFLPKNSEFDLSMINEDFAYLFVGHWMQGDLGEDRKDVGGLVKTFLETFKNKKKTPALVLKASGGGASYMDREFILNRIDQIRNTVKAKTLPNIYLLHGELTNKEINELYNHKKIKAMVSLTKGEGFGRPLLEFSLTKKPIITSNWSGHLDFLDPNSTTLVKGELKQVHPSAAVKDMILKESQWFTANYIEMHYHLKDIFENYKSYKEKAVRQAYKSKTEFSFEAMKNRLDEIVTHVIPSFAQEVKIELPKLKGVQPSKLKKIELPKLKKVENV